MEFHEALRPADERGGVGARIRALSADDGVPGTEQRHEPGGIPPDLLVGVGASLSRPDAWARLRHSGADLLLHGPFARPFSGDAAAVFAWRHAGRDWLVDGHQRIVRPA